MGQGGFWKAWLGREKGATQCQISRIMSHGRWRQIYVWCWPLCPAHFFETPWTVACPADSPSKNFRRGCHSLLQGIFLTQGSKPGLLNCRQTFLPIWATREALTEMTISHRMANMAKTERSHLWTHQAATELEVALSCSLSYPSIRQFSRDTKPGLPQRPLFPKREGRVSSNSWKYLFTVYIILAYSWALILPNCTISQKKAETCQVKERGNLSS